MDDKIVNEIYSLQSIVCVLIAVVAITQTDILPEHGYEFIALVFAISGVTGGIISILRKWL